MGVGAFFFGGGSSECFFGRALKGGTSVFWRGRRFEFDPSRKFSNSPPFFTILGRFGGLSTCQEGSFSMSRDPFGNISK